MVDAISIAVSFVLTAVTVSPLYYELIRKRKLTCELERFEERMEQPIRTAWSVRVTNPNRTIEHCNVSIDGIQLPVANGGAIPFETRISVGGAHNFRVPSTINPFGGL